MQSFSRALSRRSFIARTAAAATAATAIVRSTQNARAAQSTSPSSGFAQQVASRMALPASANAVTSLAVRSGTIAAGHAAGLSIGTAGNWTTVLAKPIYAVTALADARFAALTKGALAVLTQQGDKTNSVRLPIGVDAATALLTSVNGDPVLASGGSLWRLSGQQGWLRERLPGTPGTPTALAASSSGSLAIAVGPDLFERTPQHGSWTPVALSNEHEGWAPPAISHLAYDSKGRLWFASTQGVGYRDPDEGWEFIDPHRGLPSLDIRAMIPGAAGDMWLTTPIAAMRYDGAGWEYREGRWLPANTVTAAAVDVDGTAYFATPAGFGLISFKQTTLRDKALGYEPMMDQRHKRTPYGYVVPAALAVAGDVSTWSAGASDNDGLSTAMYGAAQCFRYAVTKDPDARDKATKVFQALKFLGDVTQGGSHPAPSGFVCRAITSTSGPDPNLVDTVAKDEHKRATSDALWKVMPVRWPTSADGQWYWKCDTSSDELDGHFFFYALYYDLVATSGSQRDEVVAVVRRLADHLVDHDYNLVDYDGQPTRWGFFGPDQLNLNPWREDERGLNSIAIITYLTIADHVVGGTKYSEAKKSLANDNGYQLNALYPQFSQGIGGNNTSDENLAFLLYYALLGYEQDPALKRTWALSLWLYWNTVQYESHPRFAFTAGVRLAGQQWQDAYGPVPLDVAGDWQGPAVDSLRRFPQDLVVWDQANSPRLDLTPFTGWLDPNDSPGTAGMRNDGWLLPVDERSLNEFNGGIYAFDSGSGGRSEQPATHYLLGYWMGRYHGIIGADA